MAAGPWTPTNTFRHKLASGQFDIDSDTWKVALFLSTSNLSVASTTYAGVTNEHSNGNGYTTGGVTVTLVLDDSNAPDVDVYFDENPAWLASGGSIVARYAAIYESGGDVAFICELDDAPADVTTTNGNSLILANDGEDDTDPIFTIS